ncbi:MAG: hypothetical protein ACPLYF_02115 [Fervidobacterium sp.]
MEKENSNKEQEAQLIELCKKITSLAREEGVLLRALGAVAFRIHCPQFKYIEYDSGRFLSDLDFATYHSHIIGVERIFAKLGFMQDERVKVLHGNQRRIFDHLETGWHADVFVDRLSFCHDIDFHGRLEVDFPTIPLAELLLEKLQIVNFELKDAIDSVVLVREHDIGENDNETINCKVIARICSSDWGFWNTIQLNLEKIRHFTEESKILKPVDKEDIIKKVGFLKRVIDEEPKTVGWKLRAKVGEKKKWYKDVEDIERK